MTIIVATSWDGQAAIASDSYGTCGYGLQADHGSKLKRYPFGWVGFAGSYAMIPFIDEAFKECKSLETERQAWGLVKAIRKVMTESGWEDKGGREGLPHNEDLAIVVLSDGGKLWRIQADFAILAYRNCLTIGSGKFVAAGAVEAMRTSGVGAHEAAHRGTKIATKLISTCGGRIHLRTNEQSK